MGPSARGARPGRAPIMIRVRTVFHSLHTSPLFCGYLALQPQQPMEWEEILSALNVAIEGLNISKEAASTTPLNPIFDSVATLLATIRVGSLLFCEEIFQVHTSPGPGILR